MGRPTGIGVAATSAAITGSVGITDIMSGAVLIAAMDADTIAATLGMESGNDTRRRHNDEKAIITVSHCDLGCLCSGELES